ncbi:phenylalanine--tRNA ligase subunit beta [Peredibacter sp. HCB2-198]|uniref:phenylalanine--tRNA ligase subunit beta n=1 Tax=Peredibacter sp. HCB2-198 TaxID=3383025 RepID=UPI0038B499E2
MLISLNWIKDFVELPDMSPKELGSKFTLATAEVEDVIVKGEFLNKVKVVEVKSMKPHPDSDKLNLVTFDFGGPELKEVVCGAQNVKVGLKVPYAPIGTTLPNGMTLEPKKIRGILSDGMLCSEVELGVATESAGLMILDPASRPGTTMADYLKADTDILLDVDNKSLTHRPDLWGYLGLAREFAANHKKALKNPFTPEWEKKIEANFNKAMSPIKVEVNQDSSCLAYYGLSLDIPKMGETPAKIKNRLEAVGLRSINLIVDISNYVMIELGMPNHIFDRSKIHGGKVSIRRAGTDMKFQTLDEQNRDLIPSDTVIFDSERPLVLAGLMGGLDSGVTPDTTKLFLEVANWEAPEVRKTSVRLGLRTDSSQRYEKTLDSNMCYRTLLRLVEMISELCPGTTVVGMPEKFVREDKLSKALTLTISHSQIVSSLGMEISKETVRDIFERLDFKVEEKNGSYDVTVPSYRTTKDISVKADLIEEIGRMIGYDNITSVSPNLPVKPIRLSETKKFHRKIQDFLVMQGKSLQVMTYPLVGKELLEKAMWPEMNDKLVLVNALSVEQDRMRPSIIPSAIEMAAHNQKHFDSFSFFEIGRSYLDFGKERSQLVIGMYSKEGSRFVELANVVEKLLATLNVNYVFAPKNEKFQNTVLPTWNGTHPHEYQNIQIQGKFHGVINTVHPLVLKNFKMKGNLTLAVIDITDLESKEVKDKTKYQPLSKFPSSSSDFTVVMNKELPAASVITALSSLKQKEIKSKSIVDIFMMNEMQKAVSIRAVFEDSEKTLAAETIKDLEQKIVQVLEKAGFPLRS